MEEKTHTKSIVEMSRGGLSIFVVLQKQINTLGGRGGARGMDEGVGGNYVVVFQASLICVLNIVPMSHQ